MSKLNRALPPALGVAPASCIPPDDATRQRSGAQFAASRTPLALTLGTATPGGSFPVYGDAFAATVHEADPTITIRPVNTKGGAKHSSLRRVVIPAGSYKGIDRDTASAGSWSFVFARADLPDAWIAR